jgi:hypothetical protein
MDDRTPNLLVLLANLAVLGFTLKLYTEYFKDRKQDRRVGHG